MYTQQYFIGRDYLRLLGDTAATSPQQVRSVIVTGCEAWTVYGEQNYQASGQSSIVHLDM